MLKLRLGTYLLPPGEVVLIRTIMRLFSQDQAFGWVFADNGPYDALIMDSSMSKDNEPDTAHQARVVLKLTSGNGTPSQHTLQRPIKAEKLQIWLKNAALELPSKNTAAVAPPANPLAMSQARFKLLRWPPNALLQNDANLIRMSTLLSRRALLLSELAELSHQSVDTCRLFIEKLLPMQLIASEPMMPLAPPFATLQPRASAPASVPVQTSMPAQTPFHRGLISGIRRRLGI